MTEWQPHVEFDSGKENPFFTVVRVIERNTLNLCGLPQMCTIMGPYNANKDCGPYSSSLSLTPAIRSPISSSAFPAT